MELKDTKTEVATKAQLDELRDELRQLTAEVSSLLTLFQQAQGVVAFIKFLARVATVAAGGILLLRELISHLK